MASALIKPIFIRGNDEYHSRLLSVKLTGSLSNTEYISSMTKPATVFTSLLYKGSGIDCAPSQCSVLKELLGLLLICETLEQRQEYHYNSPRRAVMPVTVFLENGVIVEADTYVFPVESIEEEYWDDWELRACISSERTSCPAPEEKATDMSSIEDGDSSSEDSTREGLPITDQKCTPL